VNNESSLDELSGTVTIGRWRTRQGRVVIWRTLLLLAAAFVITAVFAAGYAIGDHRGGSAPASALVRTLALRGTSVAPHARAVLKVWRGRRGNLPMKLRVVGLPRLPPHTYYEVDLVRGGKPWGSCGTFRIVKPSRTLTLTLNAPFVLRKGDSWVVSREAIGGEEGVTALRPT
jgi:hypothetical protein